MRTEFQPCDPYLQLAAHYFHDAYVSTGMTCSVLSGYRGNISVSVVTIAMPVCVTGDCSHVISAIVCLESGLNHSPTNSHFKLLLLRLYATLGAYSQSAAFFDSLDIKHMLYDALG